MEIDNNKQKEVMVINIEDGTVLLDYKQQSSRPLPAPLTKVTPKKSVAVDLLTLNLINFSPPSNIIIEKLLYYASSNYPYVNS